MDDKYLGPEQLAERLGVPLETVYGWNKGSPAQVIKAHEFHGDWSLTHGDHFNRAVPGAARAAAPGTRGGGPAELALRDTDTMLEPAVRVTLDALQLDGQDRAVGQLALQLARQIDVCRDQSWSLRWLGPILADTLAALGATPMARSKLGATKPGRQTRSWLDDMRTARQQYPPA